MTYGIKNKETGQQFAGFDAAGAVLWTSDVSKAWRASLGVAKSQAELLVCNGYPAQQKPI
jgi:hypothetical protein